MYSFTWPLFRIPSARKLPFVVTKNTLHCHNESVFKEKSFQSSIEVQWNPDFSDVSGNVSTYSDTTNIFFHLLYYVTCFPYIFSLLFFFPLDYKKPLFFQWSTICVCRYTSIQFCIYGVTDCVTGILHHSHLYERNGITFASLQLFNMCTKAEFKNLLLILLFLLNTNLFIFAACRQHTW